VTDLFPRVKAVALDLDGVVYFGTRPAEGAAKAIGAIRDLGLEVFFVTNNSAKTRAEIATKLQRVAIPARKDDVLSSGYAAATLIRGLLADGRHRVCVIGAAGLRSEIAEVAAGSSTDPPYDFLVVGLDPDFNYEKISLGLDTLLKGAIFIACNRDANYPAENGRLLPGCGPIVAAIETAARRRADLEAGKPNTVLLELLAERRSIGPGEILVVGDSIESDIAMAGRFGSPSVLVSPKGPGRQRAAGGVEPTAVIASLAELPLIVSSPP
jgi:HAD superfamily hydrolase (TIGR01450 family)